MSRNTLPVEGADASPNSCPPAGEGGQPEDIGAVADRISESSAPPAPDIEPTVEVLASLLPLLRNLRDRADGTGGDASS